MIKVIVIVIVIVIVNVIVAVSRAPGPLRSAPGRAAVVAQSLQEPRTLDNYRELFGRGNRSGYLEINRVMRGSSPHASQWRRKYVELEDGVVYASDERDHAQERLVTIKEVTSVKTARSLESDTIISLSTPKECFYLHTADDAEMKDWLLSFHTTVINVLLVSNGSTRHVVAGRSQSGDMDDQPMLYASLDGNGSMGLARYGNSDGLRAWGGAGVAGSLPQPSGGPPFVTGLPTVDQLPGQTLHKSATRDFSVPHSGPPRAEMPRRVDKKEEEQAKASESAGAREKSSLASLLSSMSVSASGGGGVKSKYVPPHLRNKGNGNGGGGDLPPPEVHPYMSGDEDALGMFAMEGSGSRDQVEARGFEDESLATGTEQHAGGSENGKDNDESDGLHSNKAESQFFGRSAEQGCRATMEDFDVALPRLEEDKPLGFFAVYDGHCGTRVAELASQQLHKYAQEHEAIFEDWPRGARTATFDAFARLEREFFELATSREHPLRDGSCAIVLLVHYPETDSMRADGVAVANLGDSRAVLFNEGYVSDLSVEHSPARPDERARIEGVGGWVTVEREMLIEKLHRVDLDDPDIRERVKRRFNYVETSRVNGELAVSRALGDVDYKKPAQDEYQWFFPSTHEAAGKPSFVFGDDLVNSIPEWKHVELEAHASELGTSGTNALPLSEDLAQGPFVVLACDGLWDAITSEEAIEYCRT
ncbi:Protein phosphatase 1B [Hondaea fermentalgiana]|uniref:Protein phosphatase 1B n=1 Tax=Hondaea fermentalgiana TaxID=2315210 RepID=A0A2R5FZQ5_9STRA|nr:Protein phosphatase 1B [Hondaea fermentalgiana]|eukprot:GBG24247.1 Protein phosphatase 1B [Hondaea fermentalgiana]